MTYENKEHFVEEIYSEKGFWVGDPCYALDEKKYNYWLEEFHAEDGKIDTPKGSPWIAISTAYGDGEYIDQDGYEYGVDSGTLAVIPIEECTEGLTMQPMGRCGRFIRQPGTVVVEAGDGNFTVSHQDGLEIQINTDNENVIELY